MTRSFAFLVNPASGGGAAPASVVPVARRLREAGASVDVTYSPGPAACRALVAEAVGRGAVVVAVGGDGMVASLAGAVVEAGGVLGILPSGRGNDFARQLGVGATPEQVAATLLEAAPRAVDVIDVGGRVVVGSVYAGVDSLASELVDRAHRLPRSVQYPYAAVRSVVEFRPLSYDVVVDGQPHRFDAFTVVVANSGYYGSGMHVAPDAAVDDGLLDVVVIRAANRLRLIRALPKLYDGSHVALEEVVVLRGRSVSVSAAKPILAYGDGEPLGPLPVTAEVLPKALAVLA
ncbi:MAG TPA: YegS/Rv2252/BmrU family lipid kinase [Nocardioidaceae bacterium]|nr:YegS/Rv2252/BmrU family lipid kinase [Nocardioidaceae bacterium]